MPIDESPRNTKIEYQYISLLRFFKLNHYTVSGIVLIGVLYNFQLWIMAKIFLDFEIVCHIQGI